MDFKLSEGVQHLQQAAEISNTTQAQPQDGPEVVALQAGNCKIFLKPVILSPTADAAP